MMEVCDALLDGKLEVFRARFNKLARRWPVTLEVGLHQNSLLIPRTLAKNPDEEAFVSLWFLLHNWEAVRRFKRCPTCVRPFFAEPMQRVYCCTRCHDRFWTRARRRLAGHQSAPAG